MRIPACLVALAACHHKPPPAPEEQTQVGFEAKLQLVVVNPSSVPPNTPVTVRISGSGFEQGATTAIGGQGQVQTTFVDANTLSAQVPGLPLGIYDVTVTNPAGDSAMLRGGLVVRADGTTLVSPECQRVVVYFPLDVSGLDAAAKGELQSKLQCWTTGDRPLRVEGHADERGTTDYNLALGQRRAETVAGFLSSNGVASGRIRSVSFGEERPADPGHSEAAWSKNRRAEVAQ
jgi:peptidoglycan-associated lipoprotein